MFHNIPANMQARMLYLETMDSQERRDEVPRLKRLRQIPPQTGRFLALMAASAPAGTVLEIGTSAGYSTLWLALACRQMGRTLTTFELLPEKVALARETFAQAGVKDIVTLIHGDARDHLAAIDDIAFCFLDAEKDVYADCYKAIVPNLVSGGLLIADNVISHQDALQPFVDHATADNRIDCVVAPIGKGNLLCRKL